ncbi:hypothetical protein BG005_009249 [Podila minutissima]|nr:hypothetical protein BG005_009249 [Podila minutissima]
MNIRDQERQLQMVATPSGNTAAVMTQEAHGSETHGQDTQPPWIETPAQPAPSKSKNKNRKKKNQNQKKKATNQENKDAPDPIATVTKKLSDMTASEDKSAQPSQHDLRHKRGNDNISNATSNPNSRPHNHKNNKSSKGKDTKQHKKEKGSDISRDSPILQIENFPPLSSSYLPTTSYSQVRHQDSSVTRSQTAKKTKWQPLAYEAVTKPQKKQHNPEERVPHVDGVAE